MRHESSSRPTRCPECGATVIAAIRYGMPIMSEELRREIKEGRIVLGGCCITGEDPAWECRGCELRIYRTES